MFQNQLEQIAQLAATLTQMNAHKKRWTDMALKSDPQWERLRTEAKELLALLNEPQQVPDLYWLTYVPGQRRR